MYIVLYFLYESSGRILYMCTVHIFFLASFIFSCQIQYSAIFCIFISSIYQSPLWTYRYTLSGLFFTSLRNIE
ncbi:hypothetical protein C2G38_2085315 [Gigaspora rosea]|uniref:Uncharacterized protein n=1 Tax=Gigaspora rosea TaxID=44941 RepID=A0A397VCE1_9GLOM|nr:hypothetical protein C2G38_2085315 [Gigaspora rosea]